MIREFRNWLNEKISFEETDLLDQFKIVYIDEDRHTIKRMDSLMYKELLCIRYYIDKDEIEEEVLRSLSSGVTDTVSIVIVEKKEEKNELKLTTNREYKENKLIFKTKILYDLRDNIICYQPIDLISNQIIHSETEKYYYINNDYEILHATYTTDGSLEYIMYMPTYDTQDWESYAIDTISELETIMGIGLDYYLNSNII